MSLHVGFDEAGPERERDGLRAAVDAKLGEKVLNVGRNGLRADDQSRRDLRLGLALGEQREDLALTPAEVEVVRRLPVPVPVLNGGARPPQ